VELRGPTDADFDEVLALVQAYDTAAVGFSDWTAGELREEWDDLDLERDAWLAILDGRIAGVMHRYGMRGGRVLGDGYVHPELLGRGVGTAILAALEARALELEPQAPRDEPLVVQAAHLAGDTAAPPLFAGRGYERVRTFYRMAIDLGDELPRSPSWPAELDVRPLDLEAHVGALHEAVEEAFANEWGYEHRELDAWIDQLIDVPGFDPGLCVVVWDGDEIAAAAVNQPKRNGDWGWIARVAVREPWRRRGLGLRLLQESFARFHATGERTVALGVDADNPTGAPDLYAQAGMRVIYQAHVWRKELLPAGHGR
jgi:GNAT superfamily N-acetyltransferase